YYQLVSRGTIAKTETEYKATVCRLTGEMRRDGSLPHTWRGDNKRWMRKPTTPPTLARMLRKTARFYPPSRSAEAAPSREIWLEKDALSGVLYQETSQYDVPLMVTRGYPSLSFLHSAAQEIGQRNVPCYLYYFGDYDPSGVDISRKVEAGIREMAPSAKVYF